MAVRGEQAAFWCMLALALQSNAQVRVMAPESLVKSVSGSGGQIPGATSTFGAPFYGDRVIGRLVYGESKGRSHCDANDYDLTDTRQAVATNPSDGASMRLINIVLVHRGGPCSLRQKVTVAADKGAHAVIAVDKDDSKLTSKDMQNIIVNGDGFENEVHIPSVLVSKEDGRLLVDAVKKKQQVIVALAWTVPLHSVVRMDLWMSSASVESLRFLKNFAPKRRVLNRVMQFEPHYHVFSMVGAEVAATDLLCSDSTGKYCAEDPDGDGPITGKAVLEEDVRQLCIHSLYKKTMDARNPQDPIEFASEYWEYVQRFMDSCPLSGLLNHFGEDCSRKLMADIGIDESKVNECMLKDKNTKLKQQREKAAWSPRALRINGWRYSGILDADLVTQAICSGFTDQPTECSKVTRERDPFAPFVPQQPEGVSFRTLLVCLLGLLVVILCSMLLYKRHLKKEMRATLREEVMLEVQAHYSKLGGN